MKQKLLLIGGGGHARACIDVIEQESRFQIYGILDSHALAQGQDKVLGYPILGGDELLESLRNQIEYAFIAIGQIQSPNARQKIYQKLKNLSYNLPSIVSPLAYVSASARILEATIIMHHALINANATIHAACIINSKALVEHDCVVEDFCHLSTASVVNGSCHIGMGSFIGSNMVLRHNSVVAPYSLLYHNPLESVSKQTAPRTQYSSFREADAVGENLESHALHLTGGGDRLNSLSPFFSSYTYFYRVTQARFYLHTQHSSREVA